MSQEIGDISNSERLAVTQQLVNSDTDQKVGRISGSSDVNLRQSSTRVELTDLVDAIEEELRRLKQDEDSPSPSDLPFPSEIDGLPAETPIKREDVEETTVVLDELAIKAPLVRRGITDLGTATSIVTGGLTLSQLSDPSLGLCASFILLVAGVLSADQLREFLNRFKSSGAAGGPPGPA